MVVLLLCSSWYYFNAILSLEEPLLTVNAGISFVPDCPIKEPPLTVQSDANGVVAAATMF